MRFAIIAVVTASGCGGPLYEAGMLGPHAQQVDCLDVRVIRVAPSEAQGPVLAVGFGNRCAHHVTVDLSRLHVVGEDAHGVQLDLVAYDPRHEIVGLPLDSGGAGVEWIEFHAPEQLAIEYVDVDIAGIEGAHGAPAQWVHLRTIEEPTTGGMP